MGDIAELMLDGTLCECCGAYIASEGCGTARYCEYCNQTVEVQKRRNKPKAKHKPATPKEPAA